MGEFKQCSVCKQEKPLTEFYQQKKQSKKRGHYIYRNPECKKCTKDRCYHWIDKNPDKYEENWKDQIENPSPKRVKYLREHGKRQKETGYYKQWQQKNTDKISEYNRKREKDKNHKISNKQWTMCKEFFNYSCAYCGVSEQSHIELYNQQLHKEHVDHNGSNGIDNCVPSCKNCNSQKWKHDFFEWYSTENENFTEERFSKILDWLEQHQ